MGRQHCCGKGTEASEGVPHKHGRPLDDLLKKCRGLLPPTLVIQRASLAKPRLIRRAKSQEVEAEHLPALGRQFWSDAAPMPARGPETVEQY